MLFPSYSALGKGGICCSTRPIDKKEVQRQWQVREVRFIIKLVFLFRLVSGAKLLLLLLDNAWIIFACHPSWIARAVCNDHDDCCAFLFRTFSPRPTNGEQVFAFILCASAPTLLSTKIRL
jgi:hypothetical protein